MTPNLDMDTASYIDYLRRRATDNALGVAADEMDADTRALATVVIDMHDTVKDLSDKMDMVIERLDRRCCAWAGDLIGAVAKNKAAMGAIIAAILAAGATILNAAAHLLQR